MKISNTISNMGLIHNKGLRTDAGGTQAAQVAFDRNTSGASQAGPTGLAGAQVAPVLPSIENMIPNRLLASLPDAELERLLPALEPVPLVARRTLEDQLTEQHFVYFPAGAVVSHLTSFSDGSSCETALTGPEGIVGLSVVLGTNRPAQTAHVTIPGSVFRMRAESCAREFAAGGAFQRLLLEHIGAHLTQVAQRSACTNRHRLSQRLAVWLLLVHDRTREGSLQLTHELMADRLGTRRAGVTEVACAFQSQGLISYSRGVLRILNRAGLESAACECYGLMRERQPAFC